MEKAQLSPSAGCIAAQEGIEHGLLQALLVLPTPGNHGPFTVRCVQVVAVTGKCEAVRKEQNPVCTACLLKLDQPVGDRCGEVPMSLLPRRDPGRECLQPRRRL